MNSEQINLINQIEDTLIGTCHNLPDMCNKIQCVCVQFPTNGLIAIITIPILTIIGVFYIRKRHITNNMEGNA